MATTRDNTSTGDRRVRRTQAALQQALVHLAGERDLAEIAVADVAEHAGINRSTFYAHYRDVDELAEAACTAIIDDLVESLPPLGPGQADPAQGSPSQQLVAFFVNIAEYANLYRSLLGPQGSARVADHIRRRITTAVHVAVRVAAGTEIRPADTAATDSPHDVPAAFAAGALIGVATDWLHRGCPGKPAELAARTWPLVTAIQYLPPPPMG
jgi:AcrR family transcriptional regulator